MLKKRICLNLVVFVLLFADSCVVFSQANNDSVVIYSLEELQVTGKKSVNEIIPPQKLSGDMLKNLASESVADAVRFFAGVQIKDYGGIGGIKTINVRSMGTTQIGVFYDGVQLGNAQNGQVDLGRFSLDNIESIYIYNGQKSAPLQSAKDYVSSGTIYINTLLPQFSENKNFNFTTRVKTGSFGLINPSILWQQKISKNLKSSFSTEFTNANGKYRFALTNPMTNTDTVLMRQNTDITALRTEGSLFGNFTGGEWIFQIYNFNSQRGLPGYIARNLYVSHERQWDNNFFVQGSIKKYYSKHSHVFRAKYANDYTHYTQNPANPNLVGNYYRQQEIYFSFANAYRPINILDFSLSVDYQFNKLDANLREFVFPQRNSLWGAFATSLKLSKFKAMASLSAVYAKDKLKQNASGGKKLEFSPAVMATYSPFKHFPLSFRGFYKKSFRMPAFNDLYYTISQQFSHLKPEFVSQYDCGVEYILKKEGKIIKNLNILADFYYNDVKDKITIVPTSSAFRWQMMNLGIVKIFGVDFSSDIFLALYKNLNLNILVNYSYQNARDFTDKTDYFYGDLIPYSPKHSITAVANLQYKSWRLNYCFLYTGERYSAKANLEENRIRPFQTHDVSAGYVFELKKMKLTVNLDINNVSNQQYQVVLNYPMPGTSFKVGITAEY
ncbi:MAG: TonB-dependent receptor plug domain-containing protein [Prevotellaceae bacterium]|jgi:hypothetical protein|nr:TonB-dependent receptor plug domain-containing protein [Prevotellaceae bacterium]